MIFYSIQSGPHFKDGRNQPQSNNGNANQNGFNSSAPQNQPFPSKLHLTQSFRCRNLATFRILSHADPELCHIGWFTENEYSR